MLIKYYINNFLLFLLTIFFFCIFISQNNFVISQGLCGSYSLSCKKSYTCPISGSKFVFDQSLNDGDGGWVWKNQYKCVSGTPKIYTGDCHYDSTYYGGACVQYAFLTPDSDTCVDYPPNYYKQCEETNCRQRLWDPYVIQGGGGIPDAVLCGGSSYLPTPTPRPPTPTPKPTKPAVGYLDGADCSNIVGWAYDPDVSSNMIDVHVYKDGPAGTGTFVTSATTTGFRQDVNTAFGISGNHGFTITTPESLKDSNSHSIYVHAIDATGDSNNVIGGSPKTIQCSPDLVINDIVIYAPTTTPIVVGDIMWFRHTIQNIGTADLTTNFTNRLLIDSGIHTEDRAIGNNISSGGSADVGFSTSWTATAGTHSVNVCADYYTEVAESNETNNCRTENFTVVTPTPTNTPTPTPVPAEPWYKLRDSSLVGISSINNTTPPSPLTPYDADDPYVYDPSNPEYGRFLIANSAGSDPGVVSAQNITLGGASVSSKNWSITGKTYSKQITILKFIDYVETKKSSLINKGSIAYNKINILTGDQNISEDSLLGKRPLIVIVKGNVTLSSSTNIINSANRPQIIIATGKITFPNTMEEANGVYIADSLDFGTTANQGIKIKGNIIAQSSFSSARQWSDWKKPGLFLVFDPSHYLGLLDKLSTITYDWRQIQ